MAEKTNYDELINSLNAKITGLESRLQGYESKSNRDLNAGISEIIKYKKGKEPSIKKKRERAIGSEYKKQKESKMTIASLVNDLAGISAEPIESDVTKIPEKDIMEKEKKPKAKRGRKPKKDMVEEKSEPIDIPKVKSEEPKAVPTQMVKSEKELKKEKAAERKRLAAEKKKKAAERKSKRTPEEQKKINERMAKIRAARKTVKKTE